MTNANENIRIATYDMGDACELHVTKTPTHVHVDVMDMDEGEYAGCGRLFKYTTHGVEGAIAKALAFADATAFISLAVKVVT